MDVHDLWTYLVIHLAKIVNHYEQTYVEIHIFLIFNQSELHLRSSQGFYCHHFQFEKMLSQALMLHFHRRSGSEVGRNLCQRFCVQFSFNDVTVSITLIGPKRNAPLPQHVAQNHT
jgi:hypothetical protein